MNPLAGHANKMGIFFFTMTYLYAAPLRSISSGPLLLFLDAHLLGMAAQTPMHVGGGRKLNPFFALEKEVLRMGSFCKFCCRHGMI